MLQWTDLRSMNIIELTETVEACGGKRFRADQIYGWLHKKLAADYGEMSNVPKKWMEDLVAAHPLYGVTEAERYVSKIDGTMKFLFSLHDGNMIESVLMPYRYGSSVCISSQAGCRMGCRFCASTLSGLDRNLYPSEMLDQIYHIQRITKERVSHVVVMGTGEPFDNFEALCRMIEIVSDPRGPGISRRNITVSTCGIVPAIYTFADRYPQVTLAISLHAPDDQRRRTLMPIAGIYDMESLMKAARYYVEKTSRRITFEYSLVRGVNDGTAEAAALAELVRGLNCHINLIMVNPVKERSFRQPEEASARGFRKYLEDRGVKVTVRREMGRDIQAACGQLRKNYKKPESPGE